MDNPKISVVVPVYNTAPYLARCVDSILGQTLGDIEVILVDDASPDNAGQLCDEYARKDARVRVIHKQNEGLGMARNSGMDIARGVYVTFVDSDDYIDAGMYEKMYTACRHYEADICTCGMRMVQEGKILQECTVPQDRISIGEEAAVQSYLDHLGLAAEGANDGDKLSSSCCDSVFPLAALRKSGVRFRSEREYLSEDLLFKTEYLLHATRMVILKDIFYNYHVTDGSLTHSYRADYMDKLGVLYNAQLDAVRQTTYFTEAAQRIRRTYLMNVRTGVKRLCASVPSYSQARRTLRAICAEPLLREILSSYPWKKNPLPYRMFYFCFVHRLTRPLYFLCRLRSSKALKKITKRV